MCFLYYIFKDRDRRTATVPRYVLYDLQSISMCERSLGIAGCGGSHKREFVEHFRRGNFGYFGTRTPTRLETLVSNQPARGSASVRLEAKLCDFLLDNKAQ